MTWGAGAQKRTTATGLDEKTLSDRPTSCSTCPATPVASASRRRHSKKRSLRLQRRRYVTKGANKKKKNGENPLDRLTSFRDDTPQLPNRESPALIESRRDKAASAPGGATVNWALVQLFLYVPRKTPPSGVLYPEASRH